MLKFNTYRALRYLRSTFVEGAFLLASEASDIELESLEFAKQVVRKNIGDVAVGDSWKVVRLSSTELLVTSGDAWYNGFPFSMRSGSDTLVTLGTCPTGVTISDHALGKKLTFNSGGTTPTGTYRIVISTFEEVITSDDDAFLKNVNLTESTAQKVRLVYKINVVSESAQNESPIPYTNDDAAANLVNQIRVFANTGAIGSLDALSSIPGSEGIDGRDIELRIKNGTGGSTNPIPVSSIDQKAFENGTLIDSNGNKYHINAVYLDTDVTKVIVRIDLEVGQSNPVITDGTYYTLVKKEPFYGDSNGIPEGKLFYKAATVSWNTTDGFVHSSKITDLRATVISDEDFQAKTNNKLDLVLTNSGNISWDSSTSVLTWGNNFTIVDPHGPDQTITAGSAVLMDKGSLVYNLQLGTVATVSLGTLAISVTVAGSTSTLTAVNLSSVRLGNVVKDSAGTIAYITAIDDVNNTITTSIALTGTGAATIYLDSFGPAQAPSSNDNFVLAVRSGTQAFVGDSLELKSGETNNLGDDTSAQLLSYIGAPDEVTSSPTYTSNIRGVSGENLRARIDVLTDAMGDAQEDKSAYLRCDDPVVWTGTQLQFTTNIVLEIINTKSGTLTAHNILTASSPISIANGESIWVSVNRTAASETLTVNNSGTTPIPAQTQANKDVFVLFRRVDSSGAGYLHLPLHKQVLDPGQTVRLGASGAGDGTGGTGDDLTTLQFKASFTDRLKDIPSSTSSAIDTSAGKTDSTTYSPAVPYYRISYDASKTVTGTGTSMTLSAAPAFTVKVGDILKVGTEARRITALGSINTDGGSGTPFTIEAAFTSNPTGAACNVSQVIYTKDLNNFTGDGLATSTAFTSTISEVLLDYEDTTTAGDKIFDANTTPVIALTVSSDGTNYSNVVTRTTNLSDSKTSLLLSNAGTNLYLRFFSNKSSGSGQVNLLKYKVFYHKDTSLNNVTSALYEALVAPVSGGGVAYTSIQAAVTAVASGGRIVVLPGTYTENVTVSKQVKITGAGYGTTLTGNLTLSASSANYCTIEDMRINGNINLNADGVHMVKMFLSSSGTLSNTGTANVVSVIQE